MKFLANENFPLSSVGLLRKKGYDVTAIAEDLPGIKDHEVLEYAVKEQRIILTFDRDYGELIYRYKIKNSPGIVYLKFLPPDPLYPANYLLALLEQNIKLDGKFTVAEAQRIRQRPLEFLE